MSASKLFRFVSILTLAVFAILIVLFFFKPGDSDIWWYGVLFQVEHYSNSNVWVYGALTGFFGWLFLALLIATVVLFFKRPKHKMYQKMGN